MHTFLQRANALGTFAGTVLAVLCVLVTITDYFHVANPTVKVDYLGLEGLTRERAHDRAYPVLSMEADLSSEFTWNTKQLFAYVQVEFATPANEMVIWKKIIQRPEKAKLSEPKLSVEFPFSFTDRDGSLRGREFNVTVAWHVMPRVGWLYRRSQTFSGFRLPDRYLDVEKGNIRKGAEDAAAAA